MDNDVMLEKLYWQNFLFWYSEKHGELLHLPMMSGVDVIEKDSEKFIAYKTNIPEQYFVLREFIIGTPWERFVTTVTQ